MGQELVISNVESQLELLTPKFNQVLTPFQGLASPRLMRTVMIALERQPFLLTCSLPSILSAAMTSACLGLEVDGVTGQGYFLPFKGKVQFAPGYKGYNTQAGRSGYAINAGVVREGDRFEYQLGTGGYIHHWPVLGNDAPIKGVWALATSKTGADIIGQPLSLRDIMAVMNKSPGAKMNESPWRDQHIGFPAMAEKTAKRRLARNMPLNLMVVTAALDEAYEERGMHAEIRPGTNGAQGNSLIIDGQTQPIGEKVKTEPNLEAPTYVIRTSTKGDYTFKTPEEYLSSIRQGLDRVMKEDGINDFLDRNTSVLDGLKITDRRTHDEVQRSIQRRRDELRNQQ